MESKPLETKEIQAVEQKFHDILALAGDVSGQLKSREDYGRARLLIAQAKEISNKWSDLFEPIRVAQKQALDVTYATLSKVKKPCKDLIESLTPKCAAWEHHEKAQTAAIEMQINETMSTLPAHVQIIPPTNPDDGLARRSTWKAEVESFETLLAAVQAGTAPKAALEPNLEFLDGVAKALRSEMRIPGVRAYEEVSYAKTRRAT